MPRPADVRRSGDTRHRCEFWVSRDLMSRIRREANRRGLSVSGYIRLTLTESTARRPSARTTGRTES